MSALEWIATVLGLWTILAGFLIAFFAALDDDRHPTPKRYVAPGDDRYRAYREWGGKG